MRLIDVGGIGVAVPGFVRAGRPRSRVVFISCDSPLKGGVIMGYKPGASFTQWSWERCLSGLIEVVEIGEAVPALCGRDARAPRWFSSHVTPPQGGSDNGVQTGNILYTVVQERHRSRLIEVGEIGVAVPGFVRAGRSRSQEVVISCDFPSRGE